MSEPRIERARMLMQARRYDAAARELEIFLSGDPESMEGHALLALTLAKLDRYEEATESARRAVAIAPDDFYGHWALGSVLSNRHLYEDALSSAREAVRLDPGEPACHGLEAYCLAGLLRWNEMLAAAERGLALDPEHIGCSNLRAHALRYLGEVEQAASALEATIAVNPDNPDSHAEYGFALLQRGDLDGAIARFREALRNNPSHKNAHTGLIEALKARNPLYRMIRWWILWSSHMSPGKALVVCIGAVLALAALSSVKMMAPWMQGAMGIIGLVFIAALWIFWVGAPLFEFLLWMKQETRALLTPRESFVARCVAATVCAAPVVGAIGWARASFLTGAICTLAFLIVAVPVAERLSSPNSRARGIASKYALFLVLLAACGTVIVAVSQTEAARTFGLTTLVIAMLGAKGSTRLIAGISHIKERR